MTVNCYKKLRHIAISEQNYETLRLLGHTRDSFNDVLNRLLAKQNAGSAKSSEQNTADTTRTLTSTFDSNSKSNSNSKSAEGPPPESPNTNIQATNSSGNEELNQHV